MSLSLPIAAVHEEPDFAAFLRREVAAQDVNSESQWVRDLLRLLDNQGCLSAPSAHLRSADGLARLHARFSNWWYSLYYGHPIWKRLRTELSSELFAHWAKRTYYLSKSAGATAARSIVCSGRPNVRAAFLKSTIEEYSHHHSFYALRPLLDLIGQVDVASQGPTPGCIAFDDQMLSIAGRDDFAHVFVALFQEKTASFSHQANRFYDLIEEKLNIPNALKGWRTHISFDHEHGHASDLEDLFKDFVDMSEVDLRYSILRASATVDFLVESLSELGHYERRRFAVSTSNELREEFMFGLGRPVAAALSHCIEKPNLLVGLGRAFEFLSERYPTGEIEGAPTRLGVVAMLSRLECISAQPERFVVVLASLLDQLNEKEVVRSLDINRNMLASAESSSDLQFLSYAMSAWDRPINCFSLLGGRS